MASHDLDSPLPPDIKADSDSPLTGPLTREIKIHVVKSFWGLASDQDVYDAIVGLSQYFWWYQKTCQDLGNAGSRLLMDTLSLKSHEGVARIIETIRTFGNHGPTTITRKELRVALDPDRANDPKLNNSIGLALRLWLTLEIQYTEHPISQKDINWDDTSTLAEFVSRQFAATRRRKPSPKERDYLDDDVASAFTARELQRRRNVKTHLTFTLADHMRYVSKHSTVAVYPLSYFLLLHQRSNLGILPENVINETTKSLGLLLPEDVATRGFLKTLKEPEFNFDGEDYPFLEEDSLRVLDFEIWQDRLAKLYSIFQSPATTWKQRFWEEPSAFFTFWGAAVTITIATIIFGVISTYTAVKGLQIANQGLVIALEAASSAAKTAAGCGPSICGSPPSMAT